MKNLFLFWILLLFTFFTSAQVAIKTDASGPHASAMLDVSNNSKGILIPQVALTGIFDYSTISSPAQSLLIYNTATAGAGSSTVTPGYYYYQGISWKRLANHEEVNQVVPVNGLIMLETSTPPAGYSSYGRVTLSNAFEQYIGPVPGTMNSLPFATGHQRQRHTGIWTGDSMVVWGGSSSGSVLNTGASYYPTASSWSSITTVSAPSARHRHSAIYNPGFAEMVIWGGATTNSSTAPMPVNTGSYYSFGSMLWNLVIPTTGAVPSARYGHTAVRNGNFMIVWGGRDGGASGGAYLNNGAILDMDANAWMAMATPATLTGRIDHFAFWTGTKMLIWGGIDATGYVNNGGLYDPVSNTWTDIPSPPFYSPSNGATAQWSGTDLIVIGPYFAAKYNPGTNTWTTIFSSLSEFSPTSVWTGTTMIVSGGGLTNAVKKCSGYNPAGNTYTNYPLLLNPRVNHTAIWTGTRMITFGGNSTNLSSSAAVATGEIFDPATGSSILYAEPENKTLYIYRKN